MELREGYKNTEVGIIPVDWVVHKLGDITSLKRGKFTPRPRNNPIYYGGNIPFVQTGDVTKAKGKINDFTQTLNEEGLAVSVLFKKGTILMTIAANIGYTGILQIDMACPDSLVAIDGLGKTDNNFLNYYFSFKREKLEELATTGAQMNLNIERLSPFNIPLPPTKAEQTAIATALSDADALISGLEKLIAKKRSIKQGAVQKLLQPNEVWELMQLGDVIEFKGGSQPSLSTFIYTYKEGYIRLLQIRDYKTNKHETYIPVNLAKRFCNAEDIMIGRYGPPIFQILRGLEGAYNVALMKAIPTEAITKEFAYHFLKQDKLFNFVEKLSQRSSGQTGVDLQELRAYPINLPPIEIQNEIASVLSDMDDEITALETKLEKYRNVKLGMMQNLLTGKVRLI